jgi:predicted GIY-YIG superfamily endonuclease
MFWALLCPSSGAFPSLHTFTYYSPQVRKITNLFKHTELKIAFRNCNSIQQLITTKGNKKTEYYDRSGIYVLMCKTCKHTYIGQTSRDLKQRYQEHIRYIRNNNPQSAFAQHILNNRHEYGKMDEIMTMLKTIKHRPSLITYEQFFIQAYHKQNKLITEQNPSKHNPKYNWQ